MKGFWKAVGLLTVIICLSASCSKLFPGREWRGKSTGYDKVVLHYSLGFNNLTSYLESNIDEMLEGAVPERDGGNILLILSHATAKSWDYETPTSPCLYRVYKLDETVVRDTLVRYEEGTNAASASMINNVLTFIKNEFPSKSYGLSFTSHGTGWLPHGYDLKPEGETYQFDRLSALFSEPVTRSAGMHAYYTDAGRLTTDGINIEDFADAIPMHLDYIIFDACLMGCVEVACQFKDVCDYILFSPTEIMARGIEYSNLLEHLFHEPEADIVAAAQDFRKKYSEESEGMRCVSVSVVKCSELNNLASVFREILASHRASLEAIDRSKTQALFYDDKYWFYDFRDIAANINLTDAEMERLDAALDRCIVYEAHSEKFFNLELKRVCGMSMYIPISASINLNTYYRHLAWNKAVDLVI